MRGRKAKLNPDDPKTPSVPAPVGRVGPDDEVFRRLVEELPLITFVEELWPGNAQYYVSPHVWQVLGLTQDDYERIGWEGFFAMIHPDDADRVREAFRRSAGSSETRVTEYRIIATDGRVVWLRDVAEKELPTSDSPGHERGYMLDITAQKDAELALATSEALLRNILESIDHGVAVVDRDRRYVHLNRFMQRLRGISEADVLGRRPEDIFPDLEQIGIPAMIDRALDGETIVMDEPYEYPRPDGRSRWMAITVCSLRDASGAVTGAMILLRDVTEGTHARSQLERRDVILEAASDVARLLVGRPLENCGDRVVEKLGAAVGASRAWLFQDERSGDRYVARQLFEWCAPGIESDPWGVFTYDESNFEHWLSKLLAGETLHGLVSDLPPSERSRLEATGIRSVISVPIFADGELWGQIGFDDCVTDREWSATERHALATAASVLGAGIARQHAERALRRSEDLLRQSQKMEAVGRLAGGVAHDFNNLLTVIQGYSALLLTRATENDASRADLLAIVAAADQAAGLTRQLLMFSRGQPPATRLVDLNAIVTDTAALLGRLLGSDVELDLLLSATPVVVRGDPDGLRQALVNLVVNARDAMPAGGRLTVETRVEPTGDRAEPATSILRVTDTGVGMSETTRARAFEPFFTTKPAGEGTGLGLATVFGIVTQAGGDVTLDSRPGSGTTVIVRLPAHGADADAIPPEQPPIHEGGVETVLLAEDDDSVRALVVTVLSDAGYSVIEARDGHQALEQSARMDALDLLVTDVVMPQLNGLELAGRLRESHPTLPVLFVTAHVDRSLPGMWPDGPGTRVLRKPFTPQELAAAVRAVLDASGSSATPGA